jgi:hypothetical protein
MPWDRAGSNLPSRLRSAAAFVKLFEQNVVFYVFLRFCRPGQAGTSRD